MLPLISGLVNVDRFMITKLLSAITRNLNLNYTDLGIVTGASCYTGDCRFVHREFVRPDRAIVGAILIYSLPAGDKRIGDGPYGAGCYADSHGAPRRGGLLHRLLRGPIVARDRAAVRQVSLRVPR